MSIIGNGVVIDPWALLQEMEELRAQGVEITPQSLMISENAPMILPFHSSLDKAIEESKGSLKIGTTGRGIGPAYEDKTGRRALRMCDLAHPDTFKSKLENIIGHHNALRRGLGAVEVEIAEFAAMLENLAPMILPFVGSCWQVLDAARKAKKKVLFEGAQGIMLDVNHGTYPFVTSSNTVAAMAAIGSGIGAGQIGYVLGITKAYTTRVGSGPFPTELEDGVGDVLSERGHEFGTTTGRKRRCGWFDAVQVRQAVKVSGIDGIALTKLDVMDTLPEVKICIGYECRGQRYDYLPASMDLQAEVKPIYETMAGWQTSLRGVRRLSDLPANAIKYIHRIEELIETSADVISTSPEREDTILVKDPFV
jgi:adenylosuccinate synthase